MEQRAADHITGFRGVGNFPVTTSVYDMGDRRTLIVLNQAIATYVTQWP